MGQFGGARHEQIGGTIGQIYRVQDNDVEQRGRRQRGGCCAGEGGGEFDPIGPVIHYPGKAVRRLGGDAIGVTDNAGARIDRFSRFKRLGWQLGARRDRGQKQNQLVNAVEAQVAGGLFQMGVVVGDVADFALEQPVRLHGGFCRAGGRDGRLRGIGGSDNTDREAKA